MDLDTREYIALAENTVPEVRRHLLLWHVARTWGRHPRPPKHFPVHPRGTRHAVSLPLRADPVPPVAEGGKRVLMKLHALYGPMVVNLERV